MAGPWKLTYNKFDPEQEALRESLCTLGNGYFGTRGASLESAASKVHYPGMYIAGVYNTLSTDIASRTIANEDFVNCPNWLMLNYRVGDGPWFDRLKVKILSWKIELNMRKGIQSRRMRWQDYEGRITLIESHRLVSMAHPHCGAVRCTITPENYSGKITVRSGIDGMIMNAGVERYRQLRSKHLEPCSMGSFGEDGIFLQMITSQSKIQITEALRTVVYSGAEQLFPEMQVITHGRQRIIHEFSVEVQKGLRYSVEKLVSVYTSRDQGVADNSHIAQETVSQIKNFDVLFRSHQAKWKALWKRFDIEVEGDKFVQLALRLHIFHLLQSSSTYNEDIDAGMPVRGLHGEAYRGHIFWDELFVFPFYNLHAPEITRALLMYRYRRLGAAKEIARQHGFKGAMYPWQSASTGEETSQEIHLNPLSGVWGPDYSLLQRHVSLAVAYNVWTYYYSSGDRDFLDRYGAEMMLEIAHFWSSLAKFNSNTRRFDIEGVMGPDEFHEKYPAANAGGVKNNAYTNVLAVWVLEKALYILDDLLTEEDRQAILFKVAIDEKEIGRWRSIIEKMAIPIDKNGFIEQFEGYKDLKELDWEDYRRRYDNIHRIDRILKAEGQSPDSFKVAKQADVVMLFYILNQDELKAIFKRLGYPFSKKMIKKNFDYYFKRTSHGSTLSQVVHGFVSDLVGDQQLAMKTFKESLRSDIYDTQGGTTQEGIHAGVMGSSLDLFLRSFAGLSILEDRICLNPKIPKEWGSIKFHVRYKNIWFYIEIFQDELSVLAKPMKDISIAAQSKIPIVIKEKTYQLTAGVPHKVSSKLWFSF
ncbi:Not trehalose-6-phosphate phosphatase [hydrothermal vent metagenome]|uniref:Not trehalose-6-phosphate phosphatase n=1 Tax=hydrothermal vent metagenome TaxID=652676 RepID=A0A3B0TNJ6_9ZZZZ